MDSSTLKFRASTMKSEQKMKKIEPNNNGIETIRIPQHFKYLGFELQSCSLIRQACRARLPTLNFGATGIQTLCFGSLCRL